jgi:hypothetical protein
MHHRRSLPQLTLADAAAAAAAVTCLQELCTRECHGSSKCTTDGPHGQVRTAAAATTGGSQQQLQQATAAVQSSRHW